MRRQLEDCRLLDWNFDDNFWLDLFILLRRISSIYLALYIVHNTRAVQMESCLYMLFELLTYVHWDRVQCVNLPKIINISGIMRVYYVCLGIKVVLCIVFIE